MQTRWVLPERQDRIHSSAAAVVSKVMLKTNTAGVRDMLCKMKCSLVCKGKQYYVPILVAD